jgi:hypothetical protein
MKINNCIIILKGEEGTQTVPKKQNTRRIMLSYYIGIQYNKRPCTDNSGAREKPDSDSGNTQKMYWKSYSLLLNKRILFIKLDS